jgi:MYXO-CTERM domain-containing protein
MRKAIAMSTLIAALSFGPVAVAAAQTDPNDVESVDNPVDNNDNSGFDDWGLFGLLGLLGLAGLARRDRHPDRHVTTADRNTGSYSSTTR